MIETPQQILRRTATRWQQIQRLGNLDLATQKRLMAMSKEDFEIEFQKLAQSD